MHVRTEFQYNDALRYLPQHYALLFAVEILRFWSSLSSSL